MREVYVISDVRKETFHLQVECSLLLPDSREKQLARKRRDAAIRREDLSKRREG